MGILDDLSRELSPKSGQKTPVQKSPSVSGGLGTVSGINGDGTINVTFNGATFPCFVTNSFVPVVGQQVILFIVGSQVFGLGSGTQTGAIETTFWGSATTAQYFYAGNPNGNVNAAEAGDVCCDTVTPALWQAPAPGTFWNPVSAFISSAGIGSAVLSGSGAVAAGDFAVAEGQDTTASALNSHAEGTSTASGANAHAEGALTIASGDDSHAEGDGTSATTLADHAEGDGTVASGGSSHAEGWDSTAIGFASHAEGWDSTAYMTGQHAQSSTGTGIGQFSQVQADGVTTNNTPTALSGGDAAGVAALLQTTYTRTIGITIRVVARHLGGGGPASFWTARGLLDGNGSSSNRWVGGSAPTFTLVVGDSGASSWSVATSLGSPTNKVLVTVTGAASTTIHWTATIELDEVVG